METNEKDPSAKKDYGWDWAQKWLGDDTITESTWEASPDGLTLSGSTHEDGVTRVWAEGGTDGTRYELTNHIVTAGGREDDATIILHVRQT